MGLLPKAFEGNLVFELIHPEDVDHVKSHYTKIFTTKSPCKIEFRHKHVHGGWILVEAQANPVLGKNQEIQHIVVVARAISE